MNKLSTLLLATAVLFSAFPSVAEEYRFTYSKLFTQMKNNLNEGHDDVKVGFFFVNAETKQLCSIDKAWMEKDEHYEVLKVASNRELMIPLDDNLKQANPLVFVHTPEDMQCDFSMVVLSKEPLKGVVGYEEVAQYLPQMKSMLDDLGGMFSSWFSPDVEGLTLEFANQLTGNIELSHGEIIPIVNGIATVTLDDIQKGGSMSLPQETMRVLPFIPSAK
ncbi:DUF2987 domain-containing protein [Vibrio genomosp. F10 str. 9ZC157]|uniref:DUF2987 domain-containing protein n=1 Tax=Vibrio genomosp. F10 TaxID=723171 RepID=UPI0002FE71BE|nr:DUF2987 domain-containing protein [Vibrio genomosp. F10]OEE96428.1 hypothetical protein A1QM_16960 [Vibrio genomosp. F10 str. 9ZC157]